MHTPNNLLAVSATRLIHYLIIVVEFARIGKPRLVARIFFILLKSSLETAVEKPMVRARLSVAWVDRERNSPSR